MMCVTVLASQPSEIIPTEITFWIFSHDWRDLVFAHLQHHKPFEPIESEQMIAVLHQTRQRNLGFDLSSKIRLNIVIHVNVIEAGLVFAAELAVIAHDNAGRFHQPGFNGIVQSEITYDPAEQRLSAALLSRRSKWGCRHVKAIQNSSGAMNAVQGRNPVGG